MTFHNLPKGSDPEQIKRQQQLDIEKLALTIQKNGGYDTTSGEPLVPYHTALQEAWAIRQSKPGEYQRLSIDDSRADPQERFRHVENVRTTARRLGVSLDEYLAGLAKRNPESKAAYDQGVRLIEQAYGQGPGPVGPCPASH